MVTPATSSPLAAEARYLVRNWDPSSGSGMDMLLRACIIESATANDLEALRVLQSAHHAATVEGADDAFSTAHGLEASLAAGHTDLLDMLLTTAPPHTAATPGAYFGEMVPLWTAAARSGGGDCGALERLRVVCGDQEVPCGPLFLHWLYGSAPMCSVRWVRSTLRSQGRLPSLEISHLGGCVRAGRVDVLRMLLDDDEEEGVVGVGSAAELVSWMLACAVRAAPVFPLELASLLCSGDLCPARLPAADEAARTAALCLTARHTPALQFLLRLGTRWPTWLLPAFAVAAEDGPSLECLLDALPLAAESDNNDWGSAAYGELVQALAHVRTRASSYRALKHPRPRFETASELLSASHKLSEAAAAVARLERRIEQAMVDWTSLKYQQQKKMSMIRTSSSSSSNEEEEPPRKKTVHWKDLRDGCAEIAGDNVK